MRLERRGPQHERGEARPGLIIGAGLAIIALLVFLLVLNSRAPDPSAGTSRLVLFCAAGIAPPVRAAVEDYADEFGIEVQLSYGGSGTLLTQLQIAPVDLYLAADESFIEIARGKGLVRESIALARMRPVIAVAAGNPKGIRGFEDLLRGDLRIVLGNADETAIGKITRKALTRTGQWSALESKVTAFKPTVNDVATDLKIGSADVGVIWDATANQYAEIDLIRVPALDLHERLISIGVVEGATSSAAALHFARYLAAPDRGLRHFEALHYEPVEGDVWQSRPELVLFSGGVNRMAIEPTIRAFEEREGVTVLRSYNGCGILVGEMRAGKIPDAYFACDVSFMDAVSDSFEPSIDVSSTAMVILTTRANPKKITRLTDLGKPGMRVGVANAEQSALGALTKRLLVRIGALDSVMANVRTQVPTADLLVNQILTGSLDAVVVYEANCAQVRDDLDLVRIDHEEAFAIQPLAVSAASKRKALAGRLVDAIRGATSRTSFESVGFTWRLDIAEKLESQGD